MAAPRVVKFKRLSEDAVLPYKAHKEDIGYDVVAIGCEYDENNDMYIYHTGLSNETSYGCGTFGFVRSSNCKKECYLTNSVGIIDSAIYRGEIQFRMKNRTSLNTEIEIESLKRAYAELFRGNMNKTFGRIRSEVAEEYKERAKNLEFAPYEVGDRIGQLVFLNHPEVSLIEVDELTESDRGETGFGMSGK